LTKGTDPMASQFSFGRAARAEPSEKNAIEFSSTKTRLPVVRSSPGDGGLLAKQGERMILQEGRVAQETHV